jgi:hypothetical protein
MSQVTNKSSVSVYRVYYVNTILWYGYVKCSRLHEQDSVSLTICACHWWEMELNPGLKVSMIAYRNGKLHGRKQETGKHIQQSNLQLHSATEFTLITSTPQTDTRYILLRNNAWSLHDNRAPFWFPRVENSDLYIQCTASLNTNSALIDIH